MVINTQENNNNGIPEYLNRRLKKKIVIPENWAQLPLIQRVEYGMQYCTADEWEAAQWLQQKFNSQVFWHGYGYVPFIRHLVHQSNYFGRCGFEVPFDGHPYRPYFVNMLMVQMGATLLNYETYNLVVGVEQRVPYSVFFEYKTNEIGIVNER